MDRKTIVVADAEASRRGELCRGLAGLGFEVVQVPNGDSAMSVLRGREVALLVTDLYLATGTESCLVRALRTRPALRRVKVLVLTSHSSSADREWAMLEGADAFVARPTELGTVLQLSSRLALSRRTSRRAMKVRS